MMWYCIRVSRAAVSALLPTPDRSNATVAASTMSTFHSRHSLQLDDPFRDPDPSGHRTHSPFALRQPASHGLQLLLEDMCT